MMSQPSETRTSNWTLATRTTPGERHVFGTASHAEVRRSTSEVGS
jgi:hypothetical protein